MTNPDAFRQFVLRGVNFTENELGRGSYAVVLELKYQGLKCAGKRLHRILYESGIGLAARRYLEECRLLSQMRHPHIVQFIGVFFEEGSQFPILVMEFLPTNLSSCLDRYGTLSDEISYSILHDVSLGLSYLHGQTPPIVHRDLSANNVLLSKDMTAKISDLGVAKIFNLTPHQVSQMTETPGTPAYMPPEVMVADPRYETSVDVFSFGVMMIHTFTAEWPLPKVGPNILDPANLDRVIAVTEAERREDFLRKIARGHPLMDLIMRCLSNNPQRRPQTEEIVGRMGDVVLQYPPSFENRVEMLQRISTLDTEKRELEQEIVRKDKQKASENKCLIKEKKELEQEITRKDSINNDKVARLCKEKRDLEQRIVEKDLTIQEKREEVERLRKQKRGESKNTLERAKLVSSVEAGHMAVQNEDLRDQLEIHKSLVEDLKALNKGLAGKLEQNITKNESEMIALHSTVAALNTKVATLTHQIECQKAANETTLAANDDMIATKEATIASKEADIRAKGRFLMTKEATIQNLSTQLEKTKEFLTSKQQPLKVQLSYSQCSETPVKMANGTAIVIDDRLYYGGGTCETSVNQYYITCYSLSHDKWSTLPKLLVCYFGMGNVNNELVAVGGCKIQTRTNVLLVYSKAGSWKQTIPPMPTARDSPAVVSLPTHLVVAGGWVAQKQVTNIVEIYNIDTSQWSMTDRLPNVCGDSKVVVSNNTVYLLGGHDGKNHLKKVVTAQLDQLIANSVPADQQRYRHLKQNSVWNENANTPSYVPIATSACGVVLAVGGVNSANLEVYRPTQAIYAYSSSMDSWVYFSDLPSPRVGAATVSMSPRKFLVIGGRDKDRNRLNTVYKAKFTVVLE